MDKMRAVTPKSRRRATVLLMVVSLLALLFVLVTGFLSLSRSESQLGRDISESDLVETLVEDVDELAIALIKDQIVDDAGQVFPGGNGQTFSWEDIPGYRHTSYLAALEPVWDPYSTPDYKTDLNSGTWQVLVRVRWPAVTSLDDAITSPLPFPLYQLMRDYHLSDDTFRIEDAQWNARNPFMDADGDGVPDSQFLFCAPATEALNTAAGTPISLPRFDPDEDPEDADAPYKNLLTWWLLEPDEDNTTVNDEIWQRYDEQARYEVAVRIISHGGMATLSSPTLRDASDNGYLPFNRSFVIDLFDSIREGSQSMRVQYEDLYEQNRLFDELEASAGAVEASLRRRFTLAPPTDETYHTEVYTRVPAVLAELQGEGDRFAGFGAFWPQFKTPCQVGEEGYQRINLGVDSGSGDERKGWAAVVARNPTEYNLNPTNSQPAVSYNQRHFITAVNYSDELARKQVSGDPPPRDDPDDKLKLSDSNSGATFEGALKFYLGEVSKAFVDNTEDLYEYDFDRDGRGRVIIEELARVYYDMLASHSGDGDDWSNITDSEDEDDTSNEVVSRRQQALMLAVNTVAFAAPRDTGSGGDEYRGLIDLVTYADTDDGLGITYAGYSPQPFFTEIIAYDPKDPMEAGGDEEEEEWAAAIAIELYNPQDPYYDGDEDQFALNLSQFAIKIDQETDAEARRLQSLTTDGRQFLNGREFLAIAFKDEGEDPDDAEVCDRFDEVVDGTLTINLEDRDPNKPYLDVSLLRISNDESDSAVIDRIRVAWPEDGEWKSRARDTSPAKYYNYGDWDDEDTDIEYARWNMVMGKLAVHAGSGTSQAPTDSLDPRWRQKMVLPSFSTNVVDPDDSDNWGTENYLPFAPTVPLITMNAGPDPDAGTGVPLHERLNCLPMFGKENDLRPNSFPTVGFMMFIPRYSHATYLAAADADARYHPMSRTLRRQWEKRDYTWVPTEYGFGRSLHPAEYPADFGHMPIFDNTQPVVKETYLAEVTEDAGGTEVGLPWGLLVFDYFTTVNWTRDVNGDGKPDVDPLRVPGRININAAPWYVLASLPMLGPYDVEDARGGDLVNGQLWIRVEDLDTVSPASPSPAFWDPYAGVLAGYGSDPYDEAGEPVPRLLVLDTLYDQPPPPPPPGEDIPWQSPERNRKCFLGPWLAQSAVAYRDGLQYVQYDSSHLSNDTYGFCAYADSQLHGGAGYIYVDGVAQFDPMYYEFYSDPPHRYRPRSVSSAAIDLYGRIRGALDDADDDATRPDQYGFITVGELANVKGFDSATHKELLPELSDPGVDWDGDLTVYADTPLWRGDFVKAVSLLALLDTQYLTTRSNTFTIYASVMDREERENSVRSQVTVDRSNLLPRLTYAFDYYDSDSQTHTYYPLEEPYLNDSAYNMYPVVPWLLDLDGDDDNIPESPIRTTNADAAPQVIAEEQVGYFNINHDD